MNNEEKLIENILSAHPKKDGLLSLLEKKDNELKQFYDLQHPLRQGFLLAEDIVKKWAKENYGV